MFFYSFLRNGCRAPEVDYDDDNDDYDGSEEEEEEDFEAKGYHKDPEDFEERDERRRRHVRETVERTKHAARMARNMAGAGARLAGAGLAHTTTAVGGARSSATAAVGAAHSAARSSAAVAKKGRDRALSKVRKTKSKALKKLAQQMQKPRGVRSEHEIFLTNVSQQYGERFAFLFAFTTACSESFAILIYITFSLYLIRFFGSTTQKFWEFYLRLSGFVGLLIPCVWGPAFLSRWDRMAYWYSNMWGSVGVTSIPAPSPVSTQPHP